MKNTFRLALGSVAVIGALLSPPTTLATSIYHVDLNTAALALNPNGPFALDFQLTDGDGVQNTTAVVKNLALSGGSPVGSPELTGGALGDLSSTVILRDSSFYNDLFQGFTSGPTVSFDLWVTTGASGPVPDSFAFGIGSALDGGKNFFDVFVQLDVRSSGQSLSITSPQDGVSASVRVPDNGSLVSFAMALASLGFFGARLGTRNSQVNR